MAVEAVQALRPRVNHRFVRVMAAQVIRRPTASVLHHLRAVCTGPDDRGTRTAGVGRVWGAARAVRTRRGLPRSQAASTGGGHRARVRAAVRRCRDGPPTRWGPLPQGAACSSCPARRKRTCRRACTSPAHSAAVVVGNGQRDVPQPSPRGVDRHLMPTAQDRG
jgi:hypothetical protein